MSPHLKWFLEHSFTAQLVRDYFVGIVATLLVMVALGLALVL